VRLPAMTHPQGVFGQAARFHLERGRTVEPAQCAASAAASSPSTTASARNEPTTERSHAPPSVRRCVRHRARVQRQWGLLPANGVRLPNAILSLRKMT
jgi:hypothetical protein